MAGRKSNGHGIFGDISASGGADAEDVCFGAACSEDVFGEIRAGVASASQGTQHGTSDSQSAALADLEEAVRLASDGKATSRSRILELVSGPKSRADRGDSRLCEAMGDFYRDVDSDAVGLSRSRLSELSISYYHKAVDDRSYRNRYYCGLQIAVLSFFPKYDRVRPKQACDWFLWAAAKLKNPAAYIYAARLAEYRGDYAEASGLREKADLLSSDRRGATEDAIMLINREIDTDEGFSRLSALAEDMVPSACIELAAMKRIYGRRGLPSDSELKRRLESLSMDADALAELARMEGLEACRDNVYDGEFRKRAYYLSLEKSYYEGDSALAAYYLGIFNRDQYRLASARPDFHDRELLDDMAATGLAYLMIAADEGLPFAIHEFVCFMVETNGFNARAKRYDSYLEAFGEPRTVFSTFAEHQP